MHVVRPIRLLTSLAIFAATAAGCAAISGLDQLEKVDCTAGCEAGAGDVTNDVTIGDARNDIGMNDVGIDSTDIDSGIDTGVDSATDSATDAPDGAVDAPSDSAVDAPPDAPPVDGGCGPTNTATNCGACGNACNLTTSVGSPACNGTKCLYGTCNTGRSDCNAATAPDLDGCECATPSCCAGGACAITHDNGIGNAFYDCAALNTYDQTQAMEACVAQTGNATLCTLASCIVDSGPTPMVVCSSGLVSNCTCWVYTGGTTTGHLYKSNIANSCFCPFDTNSASWH